jgi:hypothetical protein
MIFKARRSTGKIAQMNAPGAGDLETHHFCGSVCFHFVPFEAKVFSLKKL